MAVAWWLAPSVDFMSSTVRMLSHPNSSPQILSNIAIYLCAITVGTMSYYMADRKHRKAFLEARQSLEVKLNLEEQSQQQVGAVAGDSMGTARWGRGGWQQG